MDSAAAIFFTSFLVGLSGALVPGPMLTVTVARAAEGGWISGPLVVLGHGLLELVLLLAVFLGLGGFLSSRHWIEALCLAGGVTLTVMGYFTVKGAKGRVLDLGASGGARRPVGAGRLGCAAAGAIASVSNPYWTLWWATVGLGYLAVAGKMGPAGVAAFFGGHILSDFAWYTSVAAAAASGRRAFGGRFYPRLLTACGVFLSLFGAWFIYRGFTA